MSNILVPALLVFTASGLILSIQSVLVQFKVLPRYTNANIWGFLLFMSAITGLSFLGIFFCYNTVKFFVGNPLYGLLVGLILTSRLYANNYSYNYTNGAYSRFFNIKGHAFWGFH